MTLTAAPDASAAPPAGGSGVLEIRNVSKAFPNVQALDDVSLDVRPGEVLAFLGENGAGKSTLLKMPLHVLSGYARAGWSGLREHLRWRAAQARPLLLIAAVALAQWRQGRAEHARTRITAEA